jgi:hypothetical protein
MNARTVCSIVLALIFNSLMVFADEATEVFDDKEYGYVIYHPGSWDADIYRSGVVVANVTTQARESGISLRIYSYTGDKNKFIDQYIEDVIRDLKAKLRSQDAKSEEGLDIIDLELTALKRKPGYCLLHRLIFFPEQKRVFVLQAGYPVGADPAVLHMLRGIIDSLKVYDRDKLKQMR